MTYTGKKTHIQNFGEEISSAVPNRKAKQEISTKNIKIILIKDKMQWELALDHAISKL